jgi:peptide methionine sulfoxide reductase MsrB
MKNKWLIEGLKKYSLKTKRGNGCGWPSTKAPINETI